MTHTDRRKFLRSLAGSTAFLAGIPSAACAPGGAPGEPAGRDRDPAAALAGSADARAPGTEERSVVDVTEYGADPAGDSDSAAAFQNALEDMPDSGGTVYVPPGLYRIGSTIVWPRVEGTETLRPIRLRGENQSIIKGVPGAWSRGTSSVHFTGSGPLLDLRGGEEAETNFSGAIQGLSLHGLGRTGTIGVDAFNVRVAQFSDLVVRNFGLNARVAGESFYSVWDDCLFSDADQDGVQFLNDLNGSGFTRCRFAANGRHGIRIEGGGFPVWFHGCWSEANRGFGLSFQNTIQAHLSGCYFEGDDEGSIWFQGVPGPEYRSTISASHSYFRPAVGTSALSIGDQPAAVRLVGNMIDSTQGARSVLSFTSGESLELVAIGSMPVGTEGRLPLLDGDPGELDSVVTLSDMCAREDGGLNSANAVGGRHGLRIFGDPIRFPVLGGSERPDPGQPGRVFFNSDAKTLNIDTGQAWVHPDGSPA